RSSDTGIGGPRRSGFITQCANYLVLIGSRAGFDEREFLAIRIEIPGKLIEHRNGRAVGRGKHHGVFRNYKELFAGDHRSRRKRVADTAQSPVGKLESKGR